MLTCLAKQGKGRKRVRAGPGDLRREAEVDVVAR
jgi:hypothetical protein